MDKQNNMVRFYDFQEKRCHLIPANEITSEMIEVRIEGENETAWVYVSQLKSSDKFLHAEFNDETRQLIDQIKGYIDDVYYLSRDDWEEGFRKDKNPMKEIQGWLKVGRIYRNMTSTGEYTEGQKNDLLNIILGCGSGKNAEAIYSSIEFRSFNKEKVLDLISKITLNYRS
jgi:hypothetical protein